MKYYIAKTVSGDFPAVVERVIESLKAEGDNADSAGEFIWKDAQRQQ